MSGLLCGNVILIKLFFTSLLFLFAMDDKLQIIFLFSVFYQFHAIQLQVIEIIYGKISIK